jgi:hypothetical protein
VYGGALLQSFSLDIHVSETVFLETISHTPHHTLEFSHMHIFFISFASQSFCFFAAASTA